MLRTGAFRSELFFIMSSNFRVLVLTVGYGQGHRSAAAAIVEECKSRGCEVMLSDPCEADTSGLYALTRAYYRLCVRKAPWLWAMAYSQTNTADWSRKVNWPGIRVATNRLADILVTWHPDVVICTYPLFAYMLDYLRQQGVHSAPYAVVVTDALEISKPWVKSSCDVLFVPDEFSAEVLLERYGLDERKVVAAGFPVRKAFFHLPEKVSPTKETLCILYGVYLSGREAIQQILCLKAQFPQAELVVLAGDHYAQLKNRLSELIECGEVTLLRSSDNMPDLFARAHIYVGKAGAATVFEAYAAGVPVLVNYALPGQEQGNLELLLKDNAGCRVGASRELCCMVERMLSHDAAMWHCMRNNMLSRPYRVRGAAHIVDFISDYFRS